jgi:hypothetical protein
MNLQARIRRLERAAQARQREACSDSEYLDEDWLVQFEAWFDENRFAHEPDYPVALAVYRQALAQARQGTPSFDPPDDFHPDWPARQRRLRWRQGRHYPKVTTSWLWLTEFVTRQELGVPPVTEEEFRELAAWFRSHSQELVRTANNLLDLGDGRAICSANANHGLAAGCRARGSGQLAEDIRRLRLRNEEIGRDTY